MMNISIRFLKYYYMKKIENQFANGLFKFVEEYCVKHNFNVMKELFGDCKTIRDEYYLKLLEA